MAGSRLPIHEIEMLLVYVERMLIQPSWKTRGRQQCTCGQPAFFHCSDCNMPDLCKDCMVAAHVANPFHDIREWSTSVQYYTPTTLYDMGLRIAFGHAGARCPSFRADRLEAVTVRGIKTVRVDFCACDRADRDVEQIMERGWWPLGSNFVSGLLRDVLDSIVEPGGNEANEAEGPSESESDGDEETADTDSSTSD
ncbi:hypothetical protein B0H13DRAFT_2335645 [Mycena leptocephala]|nr:hypothetical protein B0H13DRAFT_2335645 [Mycena leptocephala]